MVRTRSEFSGVRVSTKAPRKAPASAQSSTPSGKSSKKYEGGNSYCPRETPSWQKEITRFFPVQGTSDGASSSSTSDSGGSSATQESAE